MLWSFYALPKQLYLSENLKQIKLKPQCFHQRKLATVNTPCITGSDGDQEAVKTPVKPCACREISYIFGLLGNLGLCFKHGFVPTWTVPSEFLVKALARPCSLQKLSSLIQEQSERGHRAGGTQVTLWPLHSFCLQGVWSAFGSRNKVPSLHAQSAHSPALFWLWDSWNLSWASSPFPVFNQDHSSPKT